MIPQMQRDERRPDDDGFAIGRDLPLKKHIEQHFLDRDNDTAQVVVPDA
jgi:hypothetical protein